MNYDELVKPILAPKGFLFPIMWTILYILMGISKSLLKKEYPIYYIQLIINGLWSIIFFVFKLRFLAFVWIILLDILVIKMIYDFYKENKSSAYLNIPYLIWSLFATYLSLMFYLLNK